MIGYEWFSAQPRISGAGTLQWSQEGWWCLIQSHQSPSKPLFPGTAVQFNTRVAQEGSKLTDPLERELVPPGWVQGVAERASKA